MGLSSLGYNGHVFWDTEIYMYPPLLLLQPQLAKTLIDYRFDRLEQAKQNAWDLGYKGAMFPWESAHHGSEETPIWALSGPMEHHLTGCVALATWQYYQLTQDQEWLTETGWPILRETAAFWKSRVEKGDDDLFHIHNVVGSDEWAENVTDDAWTNGIAKANLLNASKAAELLGFKKDPDWEIIANKIPILKFPDGTVQEYAGYDGRPVKQADVILLSYPLSEITDTETILKNVSYYGERTPKRNTPAMTIAIAALLEARTDKTEKAYQTFMESHKENLIGPFNLIMETPGSYNPYFATAAGGVLQTVLFGFGGMHLTDEGLKVEDKKLPKAWRKITFSGVGLKEKTLIVK
jgi:trehalose/maltose hydrolase-like predicted phosphorylase